jgi:hypothetical protein
LLGNYEKSGLGGWVKVPSVKQAKHAARIVLNLEEQGVLNALANDETA